MAPSVSVVMAAHDSARTIAAAISSVVRQSMDDWELIVVDDGSRDGTGAVAESFGDARIRVVAQENRGPAAARNAGIAHARAELVAMLDSDDLWLPTYLETMHRVLAGEPDAAMAYTDAWVVDDGGGRVRKTSEMAYQRPPDPPPPDPHAFLGELLRRNFVYNAVTARRSALVGVGGYDERLWIGEDWELWMRMAAHGCRCVRAPGILAVHRRRDGSLASDPSRLVAGVQEVYRVVAEDWDVDDEVRSRARELAALARRPRARDLRALAPVRRAVRIARERRGWHRLPPAAVARLLEDTSYR